MSDPTTSCWSTSRASRFAVPLPPDEAVRLALQIASALEEAHRHGILHRDLKPANVMVSSRGAADLQTRRCEAPRLRPGEADHHGCGRHPDHGRHGGWARPPTCRPSRPRASRSTRAPTSSVSARCCTRCSQATRAFAGDTAAQVLSAVLRDDPPPLPQAPSALERMVRRCLSKDPAESVPDDAGSEGVA